MLIDGQEVSPRVWAILVHAERWALSGSRAIYPQGVTPKTDWDYIVLMPEDFEREAAFHEALAANGFTGGQAMVYDSPELPMEANHCLWEADNIDLIVFMDEKEYEKWETATKVCRALGLSRRADRIMVFRALKWGKFVEPKEEENHAIHS